MFCLQLHVFRYFCNFVQYISYFSGSKCIEVSLFFFLLEVRKISVVEVTKII